MAKGLPQSYAHRDDLDYLAAKGLSSAQTYVPAMNLFRDAPHWRAWALAALLALGAGHMLAGIVFFFAFNWQDIPDGSKFLIIQGGMVACVAGWFLCRLDKGAGPAFGIGASVLIGVLLAVFGQVFQTPSTLYAPFTLWAVLSLPFAAMSKSVAHWTVWTAIFCVAAQSYICEGIRPVHGPVASQWAMLVFSAAVAGLAFVYDRFSAKHIWAQTRWFYPLLLIISLVSAFVVFTEAFWDNQFRPIWIAALLGVLGLLAYHYKRRPSLLPLCLITFGVFAMAAQLGFRLLEDIRDFTVTSLLIFIWLTALTIGLARLFKHYYGQFPSHDRETGAEEQAGAGGSQSQDETAGSGVEITALADRLNQSKSTISGALASREEHNTAWYIDVMLAVGGVMAALFAALFFASLLAVTLDVSDEGPFIVIGAFVYAGSLLARRRFDHEFARHFLNTFILAGGLLAIAALGILTNGNGIFILVAAALSAVTMVCVRDRILECLMAIGLVSCLLYAVAKYDIPAPYILVSLFCTGGAVIGLTQPIGRRVFSAAGSAFLIALPIIGGSLVHISKRSDIMAMPGTVEHMAAIGIMLIAIWWINRRLAWGTLRWAEFRPPLLILAPLIIAGAMMPLGGIFALMTLLIGYMLGSRTLAFIGALMQIYFLTMFYFDLQITLLNKSIILMVSGALFALIWAFLYRRRSKHV